MENRGKKGTEDSFLKTSSTGTSMLQGFANREWSQTALDGLTGPQVKWEHLSRGSSNHATHPLQPPVRLSQESFLSTCWAHLPGALARTPLQCGCCKLSPETLTWVLMGSCSSHSWWTRAASTHCCVSWPFFLSLYSCLTARTQHKNGSPSHLFIFLLIRLCSVLLWAQPGGSIMSGWE